MARSQLDPAKTKIRVRTFAEGLFSRLAHDLELDCAGVRGELERASGAATATLEVPLDRITVAGTLKSGRVDPAGLSPSDRADVLSKMRKDVFHATDGVVRVEARLDASTSRARLRVIPPKGPSVETTVSITVTDGAIASGQVELSLSALGSDVVRGPMNAFRIKDVVEVRFEVAFGGGEA